MLDVIWCCSVVRHSVQLKDNWAVSYKARVSTRECSQLLLLETDQMISEALLYQTSQHLLEQGTMHADQYPQGPVYTFQNKKSTHYFQHFFPSQNCPGLDTKLYCQSICESSKKNGALYFGMQLCLIRSLWMTYFKLQRFIYKGRKRNRKQVEKEEKNI